MTHPFNESQWNRDLFSLKKWESETQKSWGTPAEGSKGHVATDDSLSGVLLESRKHVAGHWCNWMTGAVG